MAGGIEPSRDATIAGINVTPFVDVTLVLLIIFLVTAKLVVKPQPSIPLSLPNASSGEVIPANITITVEKSGQLGMEGARMSEEALLLRIHELSVKTGGLKVILAVDGDVPHRRVVHVMELLRNAQIKDIGFSVVPEPSGQPAAL